MITEYAYTDPCTGRDSEMELIPVEIPSRNGDVYEKIEKMGKQCCWAFGLSDLIHLRNLIDKVLKKETVGTYLIKWPNGTISVLTAESEFELFDKIDVEGNPLDTKIYKLPKDFHLTTTLLKGKISCDQEFEHNEVKMKRIQFPQDICTRVYEEIASNS